MRIISGSFRGKKIIAPSNLPVRPTTDFAKEALFNVLNNRYYFDEVAVLDLFSGIGSISLEMASRGCRKIVAVDQDPGCVKFLEQTSQTLKIEDRITVVRNDVFQFLKRNTQGIFDIVFADPPFSFDQSEYNKLIALIKGQNWVMTESELILEHPSKIQFESHENFREMRTYGNVNFSFFEFDSD